jgi:translocation and assembly module TamB
MKWPLLRKLGKGFLLGFLLALLAVSVVLWYLTTDSFQQFARRRLIAGLESATGGRVELGGFHTEPLRLRVEVRDLTIHGREATGQKPFAHVDSMAAVVSLSAALGARLAFHSLTLDHPVFHLIFYPDGTTNQPARAGAGSSDFERIFSLSARRLEVRQGELLLQDQHIPLNFVSNDISTELSYSFLHFRYSGKLQIGRAETTLNNMRPIAWSGQVAFNLDRNGIQIQQLKARSERSQLQASGVHVDLGPFAVGGNYDLTLDLAQAAAVTRFSNLKGGALKLVGYGSWSPQNFAASGNATLRGLTFQNRAITVSDFSANGKFSISPQRLTLTQAAGEFLHGSFAAEADVNNWQSSGKSRTQEQQGSIRIKARNLGIAELLAALGPGLQPWSRSRFSGNLTGNVEVAWRQSINYAEANVAAEVLPPAILPRGKVPLTAKLRGSYGIRTRSLNLTLFSASTPASQIQASGNLASGVKLLFSTTNIAEWQPLTSQLLPATAPVHLNGGASFNGRISGEWPEVRIAGSLQLQDFDSALSISGGRHQQVMWDSFIGDVQASPWNLSIRNGTLQRQTATVKLNGGVSLDDWDVTAESSLRLQLSVQAADAAELSQLAGFDNEISGTLSGDLRLTGTRRQPQGQGQFSIVNATLHGQSFDSIKGEMSLVQTALTVRDLQMARGDAHVSATGNYDLASNAFSFSAHGANFNLAGLVSRSRIPIGGKLDFTAQVSGYSTNPQISADLHFRDLELNHHHEGDFLLNAISRGPEVMIAGRSDFKDAELQVDGAMRLRDQWPAHINFHFSHLNADPFDSPLISGWRCRARWSARQVAAGEAGRQPE